MRTRLFRAGTLLAIARAHRRRLRPGDRQPRGGRPAGARAPPATSQSAGARRRRRDPLVLLPRHRREPGAAPGRGGGRRRRSTPATRTSSLKFEVTTYDAAREHAGDPDRVRQRARHRRSGRRRRRRGLPRPVARPRARSSSRAATTSPSTTREPSTSTRSATSRTRCRSRSIPRCSGTRPTCSRRPASNPPPHKYGEKYKMPDGTESRLELRHGQGDRPQADRRRERQGRDEAGFDPTKHRPVRLRAAARRPAPGLGAYFGAGSLWPRTTARPPRSRTPGRMPGSTGTTACGTTTSIMTGPVTESEEFSGGGVPVLLGPGRDERRTSCGRPTASPTPARTGISRRSRRTTGTVTSPLNADTFRDPQGHQAPGRGVRGADVPPR